MNTLTRNQQWLIGGLLLLFMILTRSQLLSHLQDASWAIFFLVGFYLRSYMGFPIFWLAAFAIDIFVIEVQGGDNYCYTPGYLFLIPAYASLWFAGHWFATYYQNHRDANNAKKISYFAGSVVLSVVVCFFISNLGFFLLSNRTPGMDALQYAQTVAKYLPPYLQTTAFYLAIAATVHVLIYQANRLKVFKAN